MVMRLLVNGGGRTLLAPCGSLEPCTCAHVTICPQAINHGHDHGGQNVIGGNQHDLCSLLAIFLPILLLGFEFHNRSLA